MVVCLRSFSMTSSTSGLPIGSSEAARLVQDQQVGIVDLRLGNTRQALPLTARETAHWPVGLVLQAYHLKHFLYPGFDQVFGPR